MSNSETRTYTLWNRDTVPTYVTGIVFTNDSNVSHNISFSGDWSSPYTGLNNFTGNTTGISQPVTYLSDISYEIKQYVSHTGTSLVVNSTSSLVLGYTLNGNGYSAGQTIIGWGTGTIIITSAGPDDLTDGKPIVGDNIQFIPPAYSMQVTSNSGVGAGWVASGNGYSGQTAVGFSSTNYIIMSGPPLSPPTPSETVTFSDPSTILTIAAGSSSTFTAYYTNNTSNFGSYEATFTISAVSTTSITKLVSNYVGIGAVPTSGGDSGGGFDGGGFGDGGGDAGVSGVGDGPGNSAGDANAGDGGNGSSADGSGSAGGTASA